MPRFNHGTFVAQPSLNQRNRPVFVLGPGCTFLLFSAGRHLNQVGVLKLNNVENTQKLIGREVVSLETANKLGRVADLLVDTLTGQLAGLSVRRPDNTIALASVLDVHSIGRDAVVVDLDQSLVLVEASPLSALPKAKENLTGVKVMTDRGQHLGSISNVFLCIDKRPTFIYEVRSSFLDALLGRARYFAASLDCALSADGASLVVTAGPDQMDDRLEAAAERVLGPYRRPQQAGVVRVEVRTHAD
jgi:uncharacterized protein YrrD